MEDNITETIQLLDELNALVNINFEERARLQNRHAGYFSASAAVIPVIQTEQNFVNLASRSRRDRLSFSRMTRNAQTVSIFKI
jgi:hypothetical protein